MPTNLSGRFTLIIVLTLVALFGVPGIGGGIFPWKKLFDPSIPWSHKHNLRPGIDMAGGTSLLYQIKPPQGQQATPEMVQQVMQSLKRRVDPDGTKELVWRPIGNDRLEIQMPLSQGIKGAEGVRDRFIAAQQQLEQYNVRVATVLAIARDRQLSADERRDRLNAIAGDSDQRRELFGALLSIVDQRHAAREAGDFVKDAQLEEQQDSVLEQISATNLTVATIDPILNLPAETRAQRLDELLKRFENEPKRQEAIKAYAAAWDEFEPVRDTLDAAAELKRLLRGSGVLEFHILATSELPAARRQEMINRLQELGPVGSATDDLRWYEVDRPDYIGLLSLAERFGDKFYLLAYTTPDRSMVNREGQPRWGLERAWVTREAQGFRVQQVVNFEFDAVGAQRFAELTNANQGRPLAIMLDGKVISAPNIRNAITGGRGFIEGDFDDAELRYLSSTLSAGSLPAQLSEEPIMERSVGPQLGADNLRAAFFASVSGLLLTAVFMIIYYYAAGVVAVIAVLLNLILLLGVMAALNATFTLPGVAGIVLTIGMSVDANVLIYERLREEQRRGLSVRQALRNAYDRAWSAIIDANVTTLITTIILYQFGSEEVKGFGLTLGIGLVTSLFTALFVTKTIFAFLLEYTPVAKLGSLPLSFPKLDAWLQPNIDWVGKMKYFVTFSLLFIIGGCSILGYKYKQNELLDIEFAAGTSVTFELNDEAAAKLTQADVRRIIQQAGGEKTALPSPSVVAVGGDGRTYEVITANSDAPAVRAAVEKAMADLLSITPRVTFDGMNLEVEQALASGLIVPIEGPSTEIGGFVPDGQARHIGGAAIVLRNLEPRLTADQIQQRINRFRLLPTTTGAAAEYRAFDVDVDPTTGTAVVMVSDPQLLYSTNPQLWRENLAGPMWTLTAGAMDWASDLQRVTNFDASVADEAKLDAVVAMTLSVVAIMVYIWIRFGNFKFGTATAVTLVHDLFFTLAAVGFSHVLAETFIGNALLIEPFRINLTLVASVLTVLGYSVNDTVVIFDRIRENRGKYGHVSRQIINDSINQTLSRTLLTSLTTLLTVAVMYVFGGSGIHGFTFVLFIGIICATYSSIAVSAPLLLLGRSVDRTGAQQPPVGQLQRVGG